jgi:hypothetical protein
MVDKIFVSVGEDGKSIPHYKSNRFWDKRNSDKINRYANEHILESVLDKIKKIK